MAPPEFATDVSSYNTFWSTYIPSDSAAAQAIVPVNSITYPTDGATVASPVTFTGKAASGATVELWDTAQ
jgi:hypothetical protein